MSVGVVIALISAVVALSSALLSLYGITLSNRLQAKREAAAKDRLSLEVMSKYRDPIVQAAFDLQSKLFNILRHDFMGIYYARGSEPEREYARENTLYVIGQYLGAVEILRREAQFLDLQDIERNRHLAEGLDRVASLFLTDAIPDPILRIFRGEQRAIGELMMAPRSSSTDVRGLECIGYSTFEAKRGEPAFARWFDRLAKDLDELSRGVDPHKERLVGIQHALVDLIEYLDPDGVRFPHEKLSRA